MNKLVPGILLLSFGLFSSSLFAAPGEWWEVTAKMEMEGMPFAMPAQTTKICMPKDGQSDPSNTQGKDSNCKMTDVKHSGNTVKFKGTCVDKGETMNIDGESSHDANSFKSNVKMTGKSSGEPVNMKMASSGKRVGGSCDADAMKKMGAKMEAEAKQAQKEQMASACDTSKYKPASWAQSSDLFIGDKPFCPGKKEAMCKVLRNEAPRDVDTYLSLAQQEKEIENQIKRNRKQLTPSAVKACDLNMANIKKDLCKAKARSGPLYFLDANCPAEAKVYRELQRKRDECGERGFTSGDKMKQCMGGQMIEEEKTESAPPAKSRKAKANAEQDNSASSDNTSDAVNEGTKALKGLFGF